MPITLNNVAKVDYNYGENSDSANSNVVTTVLTESASILAEKVALNTSWRDSENITYMIRVVNTGIEPLYSVIIQDNLGGPVNTPLSYVNESAKLFFNDSISSIVPTNTNPLIFTLPNQLPAGETALITYVAKVAGDIDSEVTSIVNAANVSAHQTSETGPLIIASPSPSATIPKANYASVRIEKIVDKEEVRTGEELVYTFNLRNSGNIEATNIVISDSLPTNYTITNITSETDGVITTFTADDYTIGENNMLTLPTSTQKSISVPAHNGMQDGLTTVTITGSISA